MVLIMKDMWEQIYRNMIHGVQTLLDQMVCPDPDCQNKTPLLLIQFSNYEVKFVYAVATSPRACGGLTWKLQHSHKVNLRDGDLLLITSVPTKDGAGCIGFILTYSCNGTHYNTLYRLPTNSDSHCYWLININSPSCAHKFRHFSRLLVVLCYSVRELIAFLHPFWYVDSLPRRSHKICFPLTPTVHLSVSFWKSPCYGKRMEGPQNGYCCWCPVMQFDL